MLNAWFGSRSSRHSRQAPSNPPPALEHTQSGPSDASSVTQSLQTPGNLASASDVPLDEVHAHINDPSVYAPTPSLIHSADKEAGTLRTPDAPTASLDAPTYQRDSAHIAKRVSTPDHPEGTPFTPQDAILTQVFGKSIPPATDRAHGTPAQPPVSLMTRTSDSLPPPPSMQTPPSSRMRPPGPMLTIYDPFSGVKLGEGEHTPMSPSTATATATVTPGDPGPSCAAPLSTVPGADDRKLWSSLERILELQAEIAAMHADMEGVGGRGTGNVHPGAGGGIGMAVGTAGEGGRAGPRKRSRKGQTLPIGDEEPEEHFTGGAVSEISTEHSEGEEEGEDEEDEDDVHGYGKRRRDQEFARLAEQFAQRKAAIGGIMNKLDDLSMALKTFHTLPPPLFDLATPPSRTDTMSSFPSNASAPSSPPPLHIYPGRSSSSISPSQVVPITPPNVPLPPPVPPISTLAPPVSLEDPNAPPVLGVVVAPVLPRTASPRIIPGAPHVESPADMKPTQSVLHGMP